MRVGRRFGGALMHRFDGRRGRGRVVARTVTQSNFALTSAPLPLSLALRCGPGFDSFFRHEIDCLFFLSTDFRISISISCPLYSVLRASKLCKRGIMFLFAPS